MPRRPRRLAWWASAAALATLVGVSAGLAGVSFTPDQRPEAAAETEAVEPSTAPESRPETAPSDPPPPPPPPPEPEPEPPVDIRSRIEWRDSSALGSPSAGGRLVNGVQLPSSGPGFHTWDPVLRRVPNRSWRRYGHDQVIRTVLDVIDRYREEFPNAPPLLIGDLSRPRGGDFGPQWGSRGHVSHQNGLDVDVYYPRADRRLRRATRPEQVNPRLTQWLVDQFVAAGPEYVFTGPSLGLRGPRGVVQPLANHDDHLHIRFRNPGSSG